MAGTKNVTLLVIRDNDNDIEQAGFTGDEYSIVCANTKAAKAMAADHGVRNWSKDQMGPLPGKQADLLRKYFRNPEDDTAEEWKLPSGDTFMPSATYEIYSVPYFDEERALKLLEKDSKGAYKSGKGKDKVKTEDDPVGTRS
jgi:hypothetical protein